MIYVNFLLIYFLIGFIISMFFSDLDLHDIWLITFVWPIYLIALMIGFIYYYISGDNSDFIKKDCGCAN